MLTTLLGWAAYRAYGYFTTRSHLRAAREALDRHEWCDARQQLEACLDAWPDNPAAHLLAARTARRLELLDEAQPHLDTRQRLEGGENHAVRVERVLT